ncbi:hypothetical protein ACJX0J_020944 [Zea mays]
MYLFHISLFIYLPYYLPLLYVGAIAVALSKQVEYESAREKEAREKEAREMEVTQIDDFSIKSKENRESFICACEADQESALIWLRNEIGVFSRLFKKYVFKIVYQSTQSLVLAFWLALEVFATKNGNRSGGRFLSLFNLCFN